MTAFADQAPCFTSNRLRLWYALLRPYWTSQEKWIAWGLLLLILACSVGFVQLSVKFNQWSYGLYHAIETYDKVAFLKALRDFCPLVASLIALFVTGNFIQTYLILRWRTWHTQHFLDAWLADSRHYRMTFLKTVENIDQRVSEDILQLAQFSLLIFLSLFKSVMTLVSFGLLLWAVAPDYVFQLPGTDMMVNTKYILVIAILAYPILSTLIIYMVGRPLFGLNFLHERFEARFRYRLMRIREYRQEISTYNAAYNEKNILTHSFQDIYRITISLAKRYLYLNIANNGLNNLGIFAQTLPLVPAYFAHAITFAIFMQIASIFNTLENALFVFVDQFTRIAELAATVDRLAQVNQAFEQLDSPPPHSAITSQSADHMAVTDLALLRPDGSLIAGPITLDIAPGEHLLLMGKSGCGKSTLLLTLLGLWPFAKGTITRPKKASLFALSQRPYMPLGTLRDALYYPHHDTLDTSLIEPLLRESNLAHLIPQLDSEEEWKNILSLGEQQRVSMIRAIMHRPDILLMDEPTSSLDEASEATMFALLQRYLPHSTWVTIGHGSTLARYHSRTLQFQDIGA